MISCLVVDDDAVSREVLMRYVEQCEGLSLLGWCADAATAAAVLQCEQVDLLFLDVMLPGRSGFELLRALQERPQVVVVSSRASFAFDAFDLEVTDYLLKPVRQGTFLRAVARAERRRASPRSTSAEPYVFVRQEGRLVRVDLSRVLHIEAKGDYVYLHGPGGSRLIHATLKELQASLPPDSFVRVHRSHIVHVDQIVDMDETTVVVGRNEVPVSANGRAELLRRVPAL